MKIFWVSFSFIAWLINLCYFVETKADSLVLGSVDIALLPHALHHLTGKTAWNLASMVTCSVHAERITWWRHLNPLLGRVRVHWGGGNIWQKNVNDMDQFKSKPHPKDLTEDFVVLSCKCTQWSSHYLSVPPQAMWEGWESPKTWRALAGKQALGGHPSRRQCSGRTPQGPQQGCLTEVPALGRLGTPSEHHLHTEVDVQEPNQSKPKKSALHFKQFQNQNQWNHIYFKNWPTRTSTEARESSSQSMSSALSSDTPSLALGLMG